MMDPSDPRAKHFAFAEALRQCPMPNHSVFPRNIHRVRARQDILNHIEAGKIGPVDGWSLAWFPWANFFGLTTEEVRALSATIFGE